MQDNRRKANSPVINFPFCPLFFCRDTHPLQLEMAACIRRDLYLHSTYLQKECIFSACPRAKDMRRRITKIVLFIFCEPGVCDLSKPRGNFYAQTRICFLFQNPSFLPSLPFLPPIILLRCKKTQPKSRPEMQLSCQSLPFTR
jgi:hypothetical protein